MSNDLIGKFFVVENVKFSGIHIQHPRPMDGGRDIALGSWEAKIYPHEEWENSPFLAEQIDEGRVKTYFADKRPAPIPKLPPEAPTNPESVRTIYRIALGDAEIEGESLPVMLINLSPNREGVYTEYRGGNVDAAWLKDTMFPILEWALWVLNNFPRARFKNRIPLIEKRLDEIRHLP
jgi:hypothetical protein